MALSGKSLGWIGDPSASQVSHEFTDDIHGVIMAEYGCSRVGPE